MKGFLSENFLLTCDRARRLYHDFAASRCWADSIIRIDDGNA
jgi:hypothetical protein